MNSRFPTTADPWRKPQHAAKSLIAPRVPAAKPLSECLIQRKAACACGGRCPGCQAAELEAASDSSGRRLSRPDDPLEREADALAAKVIGSPGADKSQPQGRAPPEVTRSASLEPAGNAAGDDLDAIVRHGTADGGRALDPASRAYMETRIGGDFGAVRVHTGAGAALSAQLVNASAYTVNNHIVFAAGQYAPGTARGGRLLAHELVHVAQQQTPAAARSITREKASDAGPAAPVAEPADLRNYARLAEIVFKAIDRVGTDEEAVYGALEELNRQPAAIEKLKSAYAQQYPGHDLLADIRDDFSGSELEYCLQLLNLGEASSEQHIEASADTTDAGLARAAKRLRDAFETFWGTDEEATYAVLLPFQRDPAKLGPLKGAYQKAYGEDLKARVLDEFSGSQLDYALFLLLTPQEAYEYYLTQASESLSGGVPGGRSVGTQVVDNPEARYDREFWEADNPVNDQGVATMAALRLRKDKRPSEAIQAMYDSMTQLASNAYLFGAWRADCAEWVQVHHLYAMLKVLGPYRFDQRFGGEDFWFRNHRSTGLRAKMLYARYSIGEPLRPALLKNGEPQFGKADDLQFDSSLPGRDADELLAEAPIGSRVAWFNEAIRDPLVGGRQPTPEQQGFAVENSIKIGRDHYNAHGFGLKINLTRRELIERSLAYGSNPKLSQEENIRKTVYVGEIEIYQTLGNEPWTP